MATKKISLEERLQRHSTARELSGLLGRGIDHLPVNELTRTMLKYKSSEVVVTLAETGTALTAAAKDGSESFQRARAEETGATADASSATRWGQRRPAASTTPPPEDLSVRLERLAALRASGALDEHEYQAAKAKVLGLG
jgi:hypothetical protein